MPKRTYLGLFLISLVTLMHEILMTRIFSITMDYPLPMWEFLSVYSG